MPHLNEQYEAWIGRKITDASGHKIGRIDDIYTDDDTGQPEWLAVSTGLKGPDTHFVPMRGACANGGGVQVPFRKDQVKAAPRACADGRLSHMEKGRLYAHYGYSLVEERNRLQRTLGFDVPEPAPPAQRLELCPPVDLREVSKPADVPDVSAPSEARHQTETLPPAGASKSRGRWPDDEAIFGLIDEAAPPTLESSGSSRRR